jgi:hypothetical protein
MLLLTGSQSFAPVNILELTLPPGNDSFSRLRSRGCHAQARETNGRNSSLSNAQASVAS